MADCWPGVLFADGLALLIEGCSHWSADQYSMVLPNKIWTRSNGLAVPCMSAKLGYAQCFCGKSAACAIVGSIVGISNLWLRHHIVAVCHKRLGQATVRKIV